MSYSKNFDNGPEAIPYFDDPTQASPKHFTFSSNSFSSLLFSASIICSAATLVLMYQGYMYSFFFLRIDSIVGSLTLISSKHKV